MHVLMKWHENELLGGIKPRNQLVANIWEPCDGLKVIPFALDKVILCLISCHLTVICYNVGSLRETYALEALFH